LEGPDKTYRCDITTLELQTNPDVESLAQSIVR